MDSMEFLKLKDQYDVLESMIRGLQDIHRDLVINTKHRSHSLGELMTALSKAQSEMRVAGKDSNNPFFKTKYADLASVVSASRPALTKNGLSVIQQITVGDNGQRVLVTILGHSSGEYISSTMNLTPLKDDLQSLGSAITYIRRYAYASLVGVVADDEDDDGEVAMKPLRVQPTAAAAKFGAPSKQYEVISKDELDMLQYELAAMPELADNLLGKFGYESLADIPKSKFRPIYERVLEIKREREFGAK